MDVIVPVKLSVSNNIFAFCISIKTGSLSYSGNPVEKKPATLNELALIIFLLLSISIL